MSITDELKANWTSEDYFNLEDYVRLDDSLRYINERLKDFYGSNFTLRYAYLNLLKYPNEYNHLTDWYGNSTLSPHTFPSGRVGFRAIMSDFAKNPRMRITSEWDEGSRANLIKGETYRASIIFRPSSHMKRVELTGIYYQSPNGPYWQDFKYKDLVDLPRESWRDETLRYEETFVALETTGARLAFGFGLGNPNMQNGAYVDVVEFRVERIKNQNYLPNSNDLNTLETNIHDISVFLYNPIGSIQSKLNWQPTESLRYSDINRIEQNLLVCSHYIEGNSEQLPYCGDYIVGQERVVLNGL